MSGNRTLTLLLTVIGVVLPFLANSDAAFATGKEEVLHNFGQGSDGSQPFDSLAFDRSGNLYGTASWGGAGGDGVVFELTPHGNGRWTEKILHGFSGADGYNPRASVIFDRLGNLYSTTSQGGADGTCRPQGCGAVFELIRGAHGKWTEKLLYSFQNNNTDGTNPYGGLVFDKTGNLYGVTEGGGTYKRGTVFKLTRGGRGKWAERVLYSFNPNIGDGYYPQPSLILDGAGNLYGTASVGGAYARGTVFELKHSGGKWTETLLYNFKDDGKDGWNPYAGLIFDKAGNLYGVTAQGGPYGVCSGFSGCGIVLQLTPHANGHWTEKILYSFQNNDSDGHTPVGTLIMDKAGNLYGTAEDGGQGYCYGYGCGTAFKLTRNAKGEWTETTLYSFDASDGNYPTAGIVLDKAGNLYGTTTEGGAAYGGVVFRVIQ